MIAARQLVGFGLMAAGLAAMFAGCLTDRMPGSLLGLGLIVCGGFILPAGGSRRALD